MVVRDMGMGWVDYDFGHSTVSQVVLRQMGVWQNRLGNWKRWWNIPNKGQPNPCTRPPLSPCIFPAHAEWLCRCLRVRSIRASCAVKVGLMEILYLSRLLITNRCVRKCDAGDHTITRQVRSNSWIRSGVPEQVANRLTYKEADSEH